MTALGLTVVLGLMLAPAAAARAKAPADDPLVKRQLHLDRSGVDARRSWATTRGGPVVVAVIDSGVDLGHPDLAANAWTNSREVAANGVDDDANGRVDDVHGWDFFGQDADPGDENGHGTHVAGVLAARGRNGIGVSGVAQKAQIMALRVLGADNRGAPGNVAAALRYAVANGARVVNVSLTTARPAPALDAAIAEADAAGVLVVVSAGNEHTDLDATPSYPACSTSPNVVAVAATTRSGALAEFSNFGASCVDLAAPGEDILATHAGGGYKTRSGTSAATAQVSGAAVLLLAARPTLNVAQLRGALVNTAIAPAAASRGTAATAGRIRLSVTRALRFALRAR